MLYVKAWSWNNVNSLIKNVNCFTLLKPICACYLSLCVVFILENRQKFRVRVHVKASSVNCHSKDVDSSDCDLCTLVNSELFELWTWVCLTSHLYPVGNCARLRLWPSFPVTVAYGISTWNQIWILTALVALVIRCSIAPLTKITVSGVQNLLTFCDDTYFRKTLVHYLLWNNLNSRTSPEDP